MRKKTIWTVAAGTTAAVLVPGVAYALVAGGSGSRQEGPGVVAGEKPSVDPAEVDDQGAGVAGSLSDAEAEGARGADNAPHQLPAVEKMASAGTAVSAVSAVSPLSAVSAASPAPAPAKSSGGQSSEKSSGGSKPAPNKAPAPVQSADSPDTPPSPATPPSADSADSPDSAD